MGLSYIVGARCVGKTHRLLSYIIPMRTALVILNKAMERSVKREIEHIRQIRGVDYYSVTSSGLMLELIDRKYQNILVDNLELMPEDVQLNILSLSTEWNVIAAMTPTVIDAQKPPPFWKYWAKANVLNLGGQKMTTIRHTDLSPSRYITDIEGHFILKL